MNGSNSLSEEDHTFKVARQILAYLKDHPKAADTVDGIIAWWLPRQSMVKRRQVVERALHNLVNKDLIRVVDSADSRKHYQLNPDRLEECLQILRDPKS